MFAVAAQAVQSKSPFQDFSLERISFTILFKTSTIGPHQCTSPRCSMNRGSKQFRNISARVAPKPDGIF